MGAIYGIIGLVGDKNSNYCKIKNFINYANRRFTGEIHIEQIGDASIGIGLTFDDSIKEDHIGIYNGVMIVIEGCIFNKNELAKRLNLEKKQGISNTYLIYSLYKAFGMKSIGMIVGEFALSIWDSNIRKLVLAIDHLGLRPLFYRYNGADIHFASTIKQLKNGSESINLTYIGLYLTSLVCGSLPIRETAYNGINRIVPGTYIIIDPNKKEIINEHYWKLPQTELRYKRKEEYKEHLRELIFESIQKYLTLEKDQKSVVSFSGGVDSAAILFILYHLKAKQGGSLSTITFRTKTLSGDEPYQDFINDYPIERVIVDTYKEDLYDFRDHWSDLDNTDEPNIQMSINPRLAQAHADNVNRLGSRLLINGTGGDELWEGHWSWIPDAINNRQWLRMMRGIIDWSKAPNLSALQLYESARKEAKLNRSPSYYLTPRIHSYLNRRKYSSKALLNGINLLRELDQGQTHAQRYTHTRLLLNSHITTDNDYCLLKKGVLQVSPFLYRPLVEFMLSIPVELNYKIEKDGQWISKVLLKSALKDILPEPYLNRNTKGNAGILLSIGLSKKKQIIRDLFLDGACRLIELGFIDSTRIEKQLNKWLVGAETDDLYNIISTEIWLRKNL